MVSPSNFAEKSRCWEGEVMVGEFERLAKEFVRPEAKLQFRVCGEQDARGRARLRCTVSGDLEVECQRCLQPLAVPVESERVLYLTGSEEEADRLETLLSGDGQDESLEAIVVGQSMDLATVVEDEVLLSLPLVSVHEQCAHAFGQIGVAE